MTISKIPIYIDSTTIYSVINKRGIPRVVRNIVKRSKSASSDIGVECKLIFFMYGKFWVTNKTSPFRLPWFLQIIFGIGDKVYSSLGEHKNSLSIKPDRSLLTVAWTQIVSVIHLIIDFLGDRLQDFPFALDFVTRKVRRFHPDKPCIIILPNAFTSISDEKMTCLNEYQKKGFTIIPIVHDLIPVTHPQFCSKSAIIIFQTTFPQITKISTGMIAISLSTKNSLEAYFKEKMIPDGLRIPIEVSYLGDDLHSEINAAPVKIDIRNEIAALAGKLNLFLMVGAIDPRKGHSTALEAFTNLWEMNTDCHLVIIGSPTSLCEEFANTMTRHPEYCKNLHLFTDANDHELNFCYQHADALIFASHVEGFGLPLVEAMHNKLPVIISDLDVFREIAGDWPTYFNPDCADELQNAIINFDANTSRNKTVPRWISWDESTKILLQKAMLIDDISREE